MDTKALALACTLGEMKKKASVGLPVVVDNQWRGFYDLVTNGSQSAQNAAQAIGDASKNITADPSIIGKLSKISPIVTNFLKSHAVPSAAIGGAIGALILRKLFD